MPHACKMDGKMAEGDSVKVKLQRNLADFSILTRKLLEGVAGDTPIRPMTSLAGSDQTFTTVIDQLIERDRDIQQLVEKALEMRLRQAELERVEGQLEKRNQDIGELQARLQDAEKLLVRLCTIQPL
ncbi:Mediator of RNA polymerase II transcription subunit 4 [Geodia barretti]|uniref:Mediator of RNA polymerase II transcription subunit 4 n=1 Tax=Geodia barretti TaxID=519541 RepID=A0AA35W0W7_GEOBA|nr:Mediator of RNA polymerase II transcription subunit 4 [Geodia barretti]